MSKEKRQQRILESAEWVWEQAQLRAAAAYQTLGGAVAVLERELPADISAEDKKMFEDKIEEQRQMIEDYLMTAKAEYEKVINGLHA